MASYFLRICEVETKMNIEDIENILCKNSLQYTKKDNAFTIHSLYPKVPMFLFLKNNITFFNSNINSMFKLHPSSHIVIYEQLVEYINTLIYYGSNYNKVRLYVISNDHFIISKINRIDVTYIYSEYMKWKLK